MTNRQQFQTFGKGRGGEGRGGEGREAHPNTFLLLQSNLDRWFPTTNGGRQNGSSVGTRTRRMHVFARLAPDLHARSVLISKISASELSRKFVKSALLVGFLAHFSKVLSDVVSFLMWRDFTVAPTNYLLLGDLNFPLSLPPSFSSSSSSFSPPPPFPFSPFPEQMTNLTHFSQFLLLLLPSLLGKKEKGFRKKGGEMEFFFCSSSSSSFLVFLHEVVWRIGGIC